MRYFIEEKHNKKEWVYVIKHQVLFSVIIVSVLMLCSVIFASLAFFLKSAQMRLAAVLFPVIISFSLMEILGHHWRIILRSIGKKCATSTDGKGNFTIRISMK